MKPLKKVPRPIPKIIRLPLHKSLLVLLLLFPTFLPQQLLAYDFPVTVPSGQRLYFDYVTDWSGDAVTVVSKGYNYCSGDLVSPSTVTSSGRTYTVIGIEQEAFNFCSRLTSITMPNSVTSIGSKAFII